MADDVVMQYFAKLGLDVSEFLGGMSSSQAGFLAWYRDITVSLNMTLQLFQQFEQIGQEAFNDTVGAAIKYADQVTNVSEVTGMSTESVQKWTAANIAVGSTLDSMLSGLKYVQGMVADNTKAGDTYRDHLDALHIAYKDQNGDYLDADTLQKNILASLSNVTNATQRDSDARLVYGKSWSTQAALVDNATKALQTYNSTPAPFSDDQIAAAHAMSIEIDQFNYKLSTAQTTIGLELMPATQSWMDLFNGALSQGSPIFTFFQYLNTFLQDAADGMTILAQDAGMVGDALSGNFSKVQADMTAQGQWEQAEATKRALMAQGYIPGANQTWDAASGKWVTAATPSGSPGGDGSPSSPTPVSKASSKLPTAKAGSGWDKCPVPYLDISSDAPLMSQFMFAAYTMGISYNDALNQWDGNAAFTPTSQALNQTFLTGQANLGANERAALATGAKSAAPGSAATGGSSPTAATPGTAGETSEVTDQTKTQASAYDKLNSHITDGWSQIEKTGLVHYTALATMAQDAMQAELNYLAQVVNFAGQHNIVQNYIVMSKSGPDWTPGAFADVVAPTLPAADFSNVVTSGGGGATGGSNNQPAPPAAPAGGATKAPQVTIIATKDVSLSVDQQSSQSAAALITLKSGG
jgi:hypothetical protein